MNAPQHPYRAPEAKVRGDAFVDALITLGGSAIVLVVSGLVLSGLPLFVFRLFAATGIFLGALTAYRQRP